MWTHGLAHGDSADSVHTVHTSSGVGSEICGNSSAGPTKVNICTESAQKGPERDEHQDKHKKDNEKLQCMTNTAKIC